MRRPGWVEPVGGGQTIIILFLLLLVLVLHPFTMDLPGMDFEKAYYLTGREMLARGTITYGYHGFKNLPIVALFVVPFALGTLDTGRLLFLVAEIATYFAAFVCFLAAFTRSRVDRWVALVLFALARPYYISIMLGQSTILAFLLLVLVVATYRKRRDAWTGILLSTAFLLKIPVGILFAYFLVRRRLRVVLSGVLTFGCYLAVSLAVFGVNRHVVYFKNVIVANRGGTLLAYNNQNLFAFIMRFLKPLNLYDWHVTPVPAGLYATLAAIVVVLFAALLWGVARGRRDGADVRGWELSLFICFSLLVFPVVWDHYYLFCIYPFYLAYERLKQAPCRWAIALWALAFGLINAPISSVMLFRYVVPLSERYPGIRIAVSTPFLGGVVLLGLLLIHGPPRGASSDTESVGIPVYADQGGGVGETPA